MLMYLYLSVPMCKKFHVQTVLDYFQLFRHNSLLQCVLQSKNANNSLKTSFW